MPKIANSVDRSDDWDTKQQLETEGEDFKPLTHEEAQKLLKASPAMSPWKVLAWQLVAGVLVACAAFALTGKQSAGWSAFYGALAVVIPAALMARGMKRGLAAGSAGAAMAGFFFWEAVKIVLTVAMLFAAPRLIASLSWLALVAGFVVTMKVVWVLFLFRPKRFASDKV